MGTFEFRPFFQFRQRIGSLIRIRLQFSRENRRTRFSGADKPVFVFEFLLISLDNILLPILSGTFSLIVSSVDVFAFYCLSTFVLLLWNVSLLIGVVSFANLGSLLSLLIVVDDFGFNVNGRAGFIQYVCGVPILCLEFLLWIDFILLYSKNLSNMLKYSIIFNIELKTAYVIPKLRF